MHKEVFIVLIDNHMKYEQKRPHESGLFKYLFNTLNR